MERSEEKLSEKKSSDKKAFGTRRNQTITQRYKKAKLKKNNGFQRQIQKYTKHAPSSKRESVSQKRSRSKNNSTLSICQKSSNSKSTRSKSKISLRKTRQKRWWLRRSF